MQKFNQSTFIRYKYTNREKDKKHIAVSLGLAPDYFSKEDKQVIAFSRQALDKGIQRLDVMVAAKILGMTLHYSA